MSAVSSGISRGSAPTTGSGRPLRAMLACVAPGVGFRHEAHPTCVAVGDELYLLSVPHTVQGGHEDFGRNMKHVAHALVAPTVRNGVAAIHPPCFGYGWHLFPR